jgi:hypothetical protein
MNLLIAAICGAVIGYFGTALGVPIYIWLPLCFAVGLFFGLRQE